jgi:hypothetical protein
MQITTHTQGLQILHPSTISHFQMLKLCSCFCDTANAAPTDECVHLQKGKIFDNMLLACTGILFCVDTHFLFPTKT